MMTSLQQSEPVTLPGRPFGRRVRSIAGYALVAALMFLSPLLVFLPAVVFHCAIRNGRRAAWAMLALGAMLAGALYLQPAAGNTPAEVNGAIGYFLALLFGVAIPAALLVPVVERGAGFGRVVTYSVIVSAIGLFAAEALMREATGFSIYADYVARSNVSASQISALFKNVPPEAIERFLRWSVIVTPASLLVQIASFFVLSLLMLGRLKAWSDHAAGNEESRFVWRFRNLSLPEWLLFAFIAGGLTPLATGLLQKLAANVLAIVTFLYFLQGLAIFRFLLAASGVSVMAAALGWLTLAFLTLTGVAPLLLSVAGLFDSFFDFRRFKRKDHPDESHSD